MLGLLCTCILFFTDSGLHVGLVTRQLLHKLEEQGDITQRDVRIFYSAVREFYITATDYALANLPVRDEVVKNASFIDFEKKESSVFSKVEFFIQRYITDGKCWHWCV